MLTRVTGVTTAFLFDVWHDFTECDLRIGLCNNTTLVWLGGVSKFACTWSVFISNCKEHLVGGWQLLGLTSKTRQSANYLVGRQVWNLLGPSFARWVAILQSKISVTANNHTARYRGH